MAALATSVARADTSTMGIVELALGDAPLGGHSCVRTIDGQVLCWGPNNHGNLGFPPDATKCRGIGGSSCSRHPQRVPGLTGATQLALGADFTCALVGGKVLCWGWNIHGQLGDGTDNDSTVPTIVPSVSNAVEIVANGFQACARVKGGRVLCWGMDLYGITGKPVVNGRVPTAIPGLTGATRISLGSDDGCALVGGAVRCWGDNRHGQLGDGTVEKRTAPTAVTGLGAVRDIALGGAHSCALNKDRTVSCWGANFYGQLGDGTVDARSRPTLIASLTDVKQVALGDVFSCALLADGTVRCWGANDSGELGQPESGETCDDAGGGHRSCRRKPTPVPGLTGVKAIALGTTHACALLADGGVRCWGGNSLGQLGDGGDDNHAVPVAVFR